MVRLNLSYRIIIGHSWRKNYEKTGPVLRV